VGSNRNGLASIRVSKEGTARRRKMYTESLFELLLIRCWALIVILLLIGCFGFAVAGLTRGVETVLTMGKAQVRRRPLAAGLSQLQKTAKGWLLLPSRFPISIIPNSQRTAQTLPQGVRENL
jgi:hypothetical protein